MTPATLSRGVKSRVGYRAGQSELPRCRLLRKDVCSSARPALATDPFSSSRDSFLLISSTLNLSSPISPLPCSYLLKRPSTSHSLSSPLLHTITSVLLHIFIPYFLSVRHISRPYSCPYPYPRLVNPFSSCASLSLLPPLSTAFCRITCKLANTST